MAEASPEYLSITQLNQLLQGAVERALPSVQFRGEISEISRPQSGHLYFTLKDADSQIPAVMWKGQAQFLTFQPKTGLEVLCHGRPTVYQKTGKLQIIISRITPVGEGLLQQKFFELKKKLAAEGLFDLSRKRSLPFLPKAIGVVTSGSGAVIHDIMVKIRARMPKLKVYLVDVRVQGDGAAQEIADGIELLNEFALVDVIIVARGGGSLEDLWAFNEELVVRAVVASKIPVISGVGHEVDISLCDLAADVRAPTPTAAAEMVVPNADELLARLAELLGRLYDIERIIAPKAQALDEYSMRLERAINTRLSEGVLKLHRAEARLRHIEPERLLLLLRERLRFSSQKLSNGIVRHFDAWHRRIAVFESKLQALSPRRVLERGYAVVQGERGVVLNAADVHQGDQLGVALARGSLKVSVIDTYVK